MNALDNNLLAAMAPVTCGTIVGLDPKGYFLVDFAGNETGPVVARSVVKVEPEAIGREAVLTFENKDYQKPIILGILREPDSEPKVQIQADGETLHISAQRELSLQCGKASLTLTKAGKIILRGTYIMSRSSGVNAIRGGSVQIN
jgi:hypothetical protein